MPCPVRDLGLALNLQRLSLSFVSFGPLAPRRAPSAPRDDRYQRHRHPGRSRLHQGLADQPGEHKEPDRTNRRATLSNIGMHPTTNRHPDIAEDHPRQRGRPPSGRLTTSPWGLPFRRTGQQSVSGRCESPDHDRRTSEPLHLLEVDSSRRESCVSGRPRGQRRTPAQLQKVGVSAVQASCLRRRSCRRGIGQPRRRGL
jgi:hypothetical protein